MARSDEVLLGVRDVAAALNAGLALPDLLDRLTHAVVRLLGARGAIVFPWDAEAGALGAALVAGAAPAAAVLAALRGSALGARALATGQALEATGIESDDLPPADRAAARALGWQALAVLPLRVRDERLGLLYVGWPLPHRTDERERLLLEILAQHAATSLYQARLLAESTARAEALTRAERQLLAYARDLRQAYVQERARRQELQEAYVATVRVLAAAIETRDAYTGGHVERVAAYAVATARELGWDAERLYILELGALLHDVGKIGMADQILLKNGPLTDAEWAIMRQHPEVGARMLQHVPFLRSSLGCVLHHHERFDGGGYPGGLAGGAIPVEARVVAVADAFDAMTTDRPYRRALSVQVAVAEIARCTGTQFDPDVAAAFLQAVRRGAIPGERGAPG
ncbi:MAG: HD domain-containing protein [Chloroflexi bacterium]|nr:HD domain-containing protein [Chloroflexota bacterium]